LDDDEPVPFHAADGLGDGGTGVAESLADAGPQRDDALFFELVDGAQVHLSRIDEIRQRRPPGATQCQASLTRGRDIPSTAAAGHTSGRARTTRTGNRMPAWPT